MTSAMILCAGFGTRLKEYTKNTPKPMLKLSGKPMLEYTISHLSGLGIKNIVINLHYLAEQITSYFGDGEKWGVKISYSYEEEPLGTAGAVKKVENILGQSENFFVLYGDVFCTENYAEMLNFHISNKEGLASIVLHERTSSNSVVEMDANRLITRFIERPQSEVKDKRQNWVNSGLYCFNKEILEYIPENIEYDFPKEVFQELVSQKKLYGYPLSGYRCAVDSPERYLKLQEDLINGVSI